jgi:hypothetical protein
LIAAGGESTRVMRAATLSCARPSAVDDTCSEVELRAVPIRRRLRDNGIMRRGLGRAGGRRGSSTRMAAPAPHWHCRPISCCASAEPPARAMRSAQPRTGVHACFVAAMMRRVPRWGRPIVAGRRPVGEV